MLLVLQLLFYVVITVHTFISFSKACITLGFLTDEKKVILTDRIVWCVMTFLLLLTSVAVVKGELLLFVYS